MLTAKQIADIFRGELKSSPIGPDEHKIQAAAEKIAELTKSDSLMLTAAAALENEVTSTLMDMLAATILATLIEEQGGGRANISFSPNSMNHMTKHYTYDVTTDGLTRTVAIAMREDSPLRHDMEAWTEDSNRHGVALQDEDPTGAKPQAEPKVHDRPVWAVRTSIFNDIENEWQPALRNCHDRADAERQCLAITKRDPERSSHVENRYCLHPECPSTGCNMTEATSDAVEG